MICPVCRRDLAPTLSICLTCGAMMNDTVREELQTKIAPNTDSGRISMTPTLERPLPMSEPVKRAVPIRPTPIQNPIQNAVQPTPKPIETAPAPAPQRTVTTDLNGKKTSQTLVDFQTKNATLPDWRLQLQNSIRQRTKGTPAPIIASNDAVSAKQVTTSGANALKIEASPEAEPVKHVNPRVANALKRIEDSRRVFLENGDQPASSSKPAAAPLRNYPFNVVSRSGQPETQNENASAMPASQSKPRLVSSLRIEKRGLDTNKLPPIPVPAIVSTSFSPDQQESAVTGTQKKAEGRQKGLRSDVEAVAGMPLELAKSQVFDEIEEIDDLAPFSMRFGAGLFDVIIGIFATAILLSPLMLSGGSWMSFSGLLAFGAALAIVLFVYFTATLGIYGRTFGMRLFSLEMIDAEENAYPTLHQAAVSSSVYILSIALGGIGFLPILFNDEKRAIHDILSGTILIREI